MKVSLFPAQRRGITHSLQFPAMSGRQCLVGVGSKLKCPLFVASEMSGFCFCFSHLFIQQ
jgi:hypothetical protein